MWKIKYLMDIVFFCFIGKRVRLARNGDSNTRLRTRLSANVPVRNSNNRRARVRAVPLNPADLGGYSSGPAQQQQQQSGGYSSQSQGGYGGQQGGYDSQAGYPQQQQQAQQQGNQQQSNGYSNSQTENSAATVTQQPQRNNNQRQQQTTQRYNNNQQQSNGYNYNRPAAVSPASNDARRPAPIPDPVTEAELITEDQPEQPV